MFLAFIFVFIGSLVNAQQGTVQLSPTATVTGEACCSTGTAPGFVYYGVRYGNAQRFQHSTENEDYSFLLNATRPKFGPVCPQTGPEVDGKVMSEDCLYLDIYVPPIPAGTSPQLPVLMFIYGGGLQGGTKDTFNASSLVADINAIVVMMNYRVGALGFLSTGDEAAKGNYGLGDCKVAVKWIQKHISKFGGDPNALTVFGESAGAGLTSALILGREKSIRSSLRAVALLSGSILIDIAYNREPKKSAVEVAQKAGCPTGSSLELVNCLKQLPLDDLLRHSAYDGVSPTLPYAFVVDGEHIPDVPIRSLQAGAGSATRAPHVLTGYLREDTSFLLQGIEPELNDPSKPVTMDQLRNIVARRYLPTKEGGLAQCQTPDPAVINRILQRYNITSTTNRDDTIWKFFHLATDSQFGHQAVRESLLYANGTGTSQLYRIDYDPGMGLGAFHTLEIMHMFSPIVQLNLTFDERLVKAFGICCASWRITEKWMGRTLVQPASTCK
ncbi:neuroligin-1-like isoform X2 [Paramacrobiotus metropolitanus]|nr:neuroligin-1-like isoform X2 [Paramacrobiotus metropolitanus]